MAWLYSTPASFDTARHGLALFKPSSTRHGDWLYSTPLAWHGTAHGLAFYDTFDMSWLGFIQHL
jgi:hypothetical protein